MNYDIRELIDLKDCEDVTVTEVKVDDVKRIKTVYVEKPYSPMFCPFCQSRMYSKGFYVRHIRHPVLSDGYQLELEVKRRKFRCTDPECNAYINEEFSFARSGKRTSDLTPVLILNDLKDLNVTCAYVARHRNVSDTYVHQIVMTCLQFDRLVLPEMLCIDEVYLNIHRDARYCVILRDFLSGDLIDILPNRYSETFDDYFLHIPRNERRNVKFIITDMYEPYLQMNRKYFSNAIPVVDSFHVIQWINNRVNLYINEVKKKYQKRDDEKRKQKNHDENKDFIRRKDSKEVYLLKRHRWVLLMNEDNIEYDPFARRYNQLGGYYSTRNIEEMFLKLDENFPIIRKLKQKYIRFNKECLGRPEEAEKQFDELIEEYSLSGYKMFQDFSAVLKKRRKEILASFEKIDAIPYEDHVEELYRRMSAGPMEGFNRKPKDMKRNGRGFTSFEFVRNRILWAERKDAPILGSPIPVKEIKERYRTKRKRGPYRKHQ